MVVLLLQEIVCDYCCDDMYIMSCRSVTMTFQDNERAARSVRRGTRPGNKKQETFLRSRDMQRTFPIAHAPPSRLHACDLFARTNPCCMTVLQERTKSESNGDQPGFYARAAYNLRDTLPTSHDALWTMRLTASLGS